MSSTSESPEVGDPVILYGNIVSIDDGIALVEVYRTWPIGIRVPVQCGALEYKHRAAAGDGGSPQVSEADTIAEAVRKATEDPGHMVSVEDDPWQGFKLDGPEVQR